MADDTHPAQRVIASHGITVKRIFRTGDHTWDSGCWTAGMACCHLTLPKKPMPGSASIHLVEYPIAYQLAARPATRIDRADATATAIAGHRLNSTDSRELFLRTGTISRLFVSIPHHQLRNSHS
jgi:hypothetical protein